MSKGNTRGVGWVCGGCDGGAVGDLTGITFFIIGEISVTEERVLVPSCLP